MEWNIIDYDIFRKKRQGHLQAIWRPNSAYTWTGPALKRVMHDAWSFCIICGMINTLFCDCGNWQVRKRWILISTIICCLILCLQFMGKKAAPVVIVRSMYIKYKKSPLKAPGPLSEVAYFEPKKDQHILQTMATLLIIIKIGGAIFLR